MGQGVRGEGGRKRRLAKICTDRQTKQRQTDRQNRQTASGSNSLARASPRGSKSAGKRASDCHLSVNLSQRGRFSTASILW